MQASPYGTTVKGFREAYGPRFIRIDALLLLAVLGLVACSLYTIGTATQDDIEGSPYYFVIRQARLRRVGLVLMVLISRFDYSRLREWRAGLYGAADREHPRGLRAGIGLARLQALDRAAVLPAPDL